MRLHRIVEQFDNDHNSTYKMHESHGPVNSVTPKSIYMTMDEAGYEIITEDAFYFYAVNQHESMVAKAKEFKNMAYGDESRTGFRPISKVIETVTYPRSRWKG